MFSTYNPITGARLSMGGAAPGGAGQVPAAPGGLPPQPLPPTAGAPQGLPPLPYPNGYPRSLQAPTLFPQAPATADPVVQAMAQRQQPRRGSWENYDMMAPVSSRFNPLMVQGFDR